MKLLLQVFILSFLLVVQAHAIVVTVPGGGGTITSVNGNAGPVIVLELAEWQDFTVNSSDFTAVANSEDILIATLAAGSVVHAVQIKHSVAFTGGGIASYTLSVGITGNLDRYASPFDVFPAPAAGNLQDTGLKEGNTTAVRVEAVSVGDTLNNAGAGTAIVRLLVSNP